MTVLLVLAMFIGFALLDHLLHREKPAPVMEMPAEPRHAPHFRHHPGHGWLLPEGHHMELVGADEAAVTLAGAIERIELPQPGRWVRQGQKAWTFYHNGSRFDMVSPVEGEVREINTEVLNDPSLIMKDPYGRGWLMRVNVPDEESVDRNLLPDSIVGSWMAMDLRKAATHDQAAVHELLLT